MSSVLINPVRISFTDANPDRPGAIKAYDDSNREVDLYNIKNYRLNTVTTAPYDNASIFRSANVNLKRRFNFFSFPFAVQTGAFPFAAGSADSAALVTLSPGVYTVQVSAAGGGPALLEVYEVRY